MKIFPQIKTSGNSFGVIFRSAQCAWKVAIATLILSKKPILNTDFTLILDIMWVKNTVASVDFFFKRRIDNIWSKLF